MSGAQTIYDLVTSGGHANDPYIDGAKLAGQSEVSLFRLTDNPPGYYPDPPVSDYTLQLVTQGEGRGRIDVGAGLFEEPMRAGVLVLAPPNTPCSYEALGVFSLSVVGLPASIFDTVQTLRGDSGPLDLEALHADSFRDKFIEGAITRMFRETRAGNPAGELFVDYAVQSIAMALAGLAGRADLRRVAPRALDDRQYEIVRAMLHDHCAGRLSMDDLAGELNIDVIHLARAFKTRTGKTLHAYQMELRVEKICAALSDGAPVNAPLLAQTSGFGSVAQMETAFARVKGQPFPHEGRRA